jgi:YkoY family integral membrane protein
MISSADVVVILFLIFLEGILSIDNALVLAVLARDLPKEQQKKALTYGLIGAVVFRLIALSLVTKLLAWNWVKFVGGGYLVFLAIKHFFFGEKSESEKKREKSPRNFWTVVALIELTDIAFAVDSILAAVALSNKFWVVFTGGILGVVMMRFAASIFIVLLNKYPNFENTAYLLVLVIGAKVILEGLRLPGIDFHHASAPSFWIFWSIMFACVLYGFMPKRPGHSPKVKKPKKGEK